MVGRMKTILAPIDFSHVSHSVLKEAVTLAQVLNGRLVLLHVVQPPIIINEYDMMLPDVTRLTVGMGKAAVRHLARLKKPLERHLPSTVAEYRIGSPVQEILAHAKKAAADYIVIGSHGHTAFYDLLVGSTAGGVLKKACCPVLVVPPPPAKSTKVKK